jgi:hypothetical protein
MERHVIVMCLSPPVSRSAGAFFRGDFYYPLRLAHDLDLYTESLCQHHSLVFGHTVYKVWMNSMLGGSEGGRDGGWTLCHSAMQAL